MADPKQNEPQSYGSQGEWVTGNTGESVNRQKSGPPPEHSDFYESRRDSEDSGEHQGGKVSPFQAADNEAAAPPSPVGEQGAEPGHKVTVKPGGSKSDSFFKKRDYE